MRKRVGLGAMATARWPAADTLIKLGLFRHHETIR
jgi:hypothetical protein